MREHDFKNYNGKKILIVSGGTGGHIIPAIVFGRWLEGHGAIVTWLSGSRKLAAEIYASHNIIKSQPEPEKIAGRLLQLSIEGSPLGVRRPKEILRRSWHMLASFKESARILKMTGAELVFLFGGYVSFAPLIVSLCRKIPVVIHEQNTIAGRVTRIASRFGAKIATGWSRCIGRDGKNLTNFTHVGIPVREPQKLDRVDALKRLGLDIKNKIIGVAGGSLGSKPLTEKLIAAAKDFSAEFIFLTNAPNEQDKNNFPDNIHFIGRQWDVNAFYSLCDVLVCRAGGSTLAEALVWNIPTVVVPWEGAAEGHQFENARCFIEDIKSIGGDAILCPENSRADDLADAISRLLIHDHEQANLNIKFDAACCALAAAAI